MQRYQNGKNTGQPPSDRAVAATAAGKLSQKVTIGQWAGGVPLFRHGWTSASTTHLMTASVPHSSIHLRAVDCRHVMVAPGRRQLQFRGHGPPATRLTAGCVPLLAFA